MKMTPPLDPGYLPAVIVRREYQAEVDSASEKLTMGVAVERENGCICRHDLKITAPDTPQTFQYVERHIKFLLWAKGGSKIYISGPDALSRKIANCYSSDGTRNFDTDLMANKVYGRRFAVESMPLESIPASSENSLAVGGHLDGCRIGFDLGASDYKLAAVIDGEAVFSTEIPWDPVPQKDSKYHYDRIVGGIKDAASHMPRLDAVGGSSAGIYVDNEVKVASLFRAVPQDEFKSVVQPMFLNIRKELGVPLVVVNDGDVTALAGAMSLGKNALLGIAMGSSEAAGYLNPEGRIMGYLNELAFAPVDFSKSAAVDEWSGDAGGGALYFSQQAVNKLAPAAGITFPDEMPLPERLKVVQAKADNGDTAALQIFESIGVYLGYTLPHYADYYEFETVLILGRVTSGRGGEIVIEKANEILKSEFPKLAEQMSINVPDEKSRRVGQAVAAASLPQL